MLHIPILRWGKPYESLEIDEVVHFSTGEPIAKVSQANGGIIQRDMRRVQQARDVLCGIPIRELIECVKQAADLYEHGTLPMGDGQQSPDDFVHQQSAIDRVCRSTCAAPTWRRTPSCCATWSTFSTASPAAWIWRS